MPSTRADNHTRTRPRKRALQVRAIVVALLATFLTVLFIRTLLDYRTFLDRVGTAYTGWEVDGFRFGLAVSGSLALAGWAVTIALLKTARKDTDRSARRVVLGGLLAGPALYVLASFLPPGLADFVFPLAPLGAVAALYGAIRM